MAAPPTNDGSRICSACAAFSNQYLLTTMLLRVWIVKPGGSTKCPSDGRERICKSPRPRNVVLIADNLTERLSESVEGMCKKGLDMLNY